MDAKELKRQFTYRELLSYNTKLRGELIVLNQNYQILIRRQDSIIRKEVLARTSTLTKELDIKDKIICEKDKQIEALKLELVKKQSIIDNDASNSGFPTSKTPIHKNKHIPNSRVETDKTIGGQLGHKKYKLKKFEDDEITETITVIPSKCPKCNSSNIKTLDTSKTKDETDYEVVLIKKRYEFMNVECGRCHKSFHSPIPNSLKEENQYGTTVQALAVCLTNEIYTPFNKTVKLIKGITDNEINLSEGYVTKLQPRASGFLEKFIEDAKDHIVNSHCYGWDDTVININTQKAILRIYATDKVSLFYAHEQKNEQGLDDDGILLNTPYTTTVMHDHLLHNYNDKYRFKNVECLCHLCRRLKKSEYNTKHKWQRELLDLLSKTNQDRNTLIEQGISSFAKEYLKTLENRYDEIISDAYGINDEDTNNVWFSEELSFIKDLDKYKESYIRWAKDFKLPTTNNNCERNLRPIKSKLKISGHFKNIKFARYYARIRSYIETCKRNGINIIDACTKLMLGKPYTLEEILNYQKND